MTPLTARHAEPSFSTFCHISQFGDMGYRALPRMIAMSTPCLWSPSSVVLKAGTAGISSRKFLDYLDRGIIRIFGRHEWLYDPVYRSSLSWDGAVWDKKLDGAIRSICEDDAEEPMPKRRVVVASEESGWDFAKKYLKSNEQESTRWQEILQSKDSSKSIPAGSLEAALRDIDSDPEKAAQRILRDAYNHGQAIAFSGADTAFVDQRTHPAFMQILATAPAEAGLPLRDAEEVSPNAPPEVLQLAMSDLAAQMLQILAELDVRAGNRGGVDSLDKFMRGSGRQELMQWMSRIFTLLKQGDARRVSDLLAKQLLDDLDQGQFESFIGELKSRPDEQAIGMVGLIFATIAEMAGPGLVGLAGIGVALYPLVKGIARQRGLTSAQFSGPNWPFLYTYEKRPRRRQDQLDGLRYALEHIQQDREFR